jgi:uncharacterized membrane protein YphA (DoxX/SURF4 family)
MTPTNNRRPATPRYWMLCVALVCQLATVAMTWQVWQVRQYPVNVPLLPLPAVSFGVLVVISLLATFIWPLQGVLAHAVLVALACVWDQYRLQPQFLSLIVLMFACVGDTGLWLARWYLAAMWLWAGIHKLLSPEWFGSSSWWYLEQSGVSGDTWYLPFAVLVALAETGLGLTAIVKPRLAAAGCAVMHLAILVSLSPLIRNYNASVWPWNLATAIVGAWLLQQKPPPMRSSGRLALLAVLFVGPAGYYLDLLNPHLAFVLYSGNMPRACHTTSDAVRRLDGWGGLTVPVPDSPRLFARVFELTAERGDKLYIQDPRPWLADQYFVKSADGEIHTVSRARFLRGGPESGEVRGMEMADPEALWRLKRAGVEVRTLDDGVSCSADGKGPAHAHELFRQLRSLLNLRELKLDDADISDEALEAVAELPRLEIIDLRHCVLSENALADIAAARSLLFLRLESVPINRNGLVHLASSLQRLEVLHLPSTEIDDVGLSSLAALSGLKWLDLSTTAVTDIGAAHLKHFPLLEWINLSGTQITDQGAKHLHALAKLQIVQLSQTRVGDDGLASLRELPNLQHLDLEATPVTDAGLPHLAALKTLKHLNVRDTQMTAAGVSSLQESLPRCVIVH